MRKLVIKKGEKFNRLTIIKEIKPHIYPNGQKYRKVLCQCECGNQKEIAFFEMKKGNIKSCGCLAKEMTNIRNIKQIKEIKIGEKFGRLTIIEEVKPNIAKNGWRIRKVLCQCECGNKKEIIYQSLKRKYTESCGCLQKEKIKIINTKHGMYKTRFYKIFHGAIARCNNKNSKAYKDYGNRGIKNEWKSFENFKKDMYESYLKHCKKYGVKETTIDRINNNGNYCKGNCKWSTWKEQNNNTRFNIKYKN